MIANTNPNYDMIYAGHEKLPANIVWLAINSVVIFCWS